MVVRAVLDDLKTQRNMRTTMKLSLVRKRKRKMIGKAIDRFLEWSFQNTEDKLTKRSKVKMSIKKKKHDPVSAPKHYNNGKVECIEYIKQQLGSEFPSYLEGSAIKYIHRHRMKNANIQDLQKAKWYIDKLIAHYEEL